jgi:hypothetical protein
MLNVAYSKFYNPSEHLAIDEVIVLFKGKVVFKQYIPKKRKRFRMKICKLCDAAGYTYDMEVYLGKDRQRANRHDSDPCYSETTDKESKGAWS